MRLLQLLTLAALIISSPAFSSFTVPSPLISRDGNYTLQWGDGTAIPLTGAYTGQPGYELYEKNLNDGYPEVKIGLSKLFGYTATFTNKPIGRYQYKYKRLVCDSSGCFYYGPIDNKIVVAVGAEAAITPKPIETPTAVGYTPYMATVNDSGYASISIPIQIPSGINGMHPVLSLNYSSGGTSKSIHTQSAGGLLGFGWSISGFSSISRCTVGKPDEQRYISPGKKELGTAPMRPLLKYDNTDGLCLDGELLVLVSGTHFGNGAVYRTYKESFRRITLRHFYDSVTKTNEIKFEVQNPNGSVAIYGEKSSGRATKELAFQSNTYSPAFIWSIDSEKDKFNNTISYYYRNWNRFSYQPNKQRIFPTTISYPGGQITFGYLNLNSIYGGGCGVIDEDKTQTGPDRWRCNYDSSDQITSITTPGKVYKIIGSGQTESELRKHGLKPSAIQECGKTAYNGSLSCLAPLGFEWLTRTSQYPDFPQVNRYYYDVAFLGAVTDTLGRRTEFQYDKIYGWQSTNKQNQFTEYPFSLPTQGQLTGDGYARTLGTKDLDNANEIDFVVVRLKRDDGVSANKRSYRYHYRSSGANSSVGKGFIGFVGIRIVDEQTGLVTYRQNEVSKKYYSNAIGISGDFSGEHIYTGIYGEASSKAVYKKEVRYSVKALQYANGANTYVPLTDQVTELSYESGELISATTKHNTHYFDSASGVIANIESVTKKGTALKPISFTAAYVGDHPPYEINENSLISTHIYTSELGSSTSVNDWRIGYKLSEDNVFYNGFVGTATDVKTKKVTYSVKPGTTQVEKEIHHPGDANNEKTITYTYNTTGLVESVTTNAKNLSESRKVEFFDYIFDSGVPARTRNSYGHETLSSNMDLRFNFSQKSTDPNGLTIAREFDALGRESLIIDDHGVATTQVYVSCSSSYCDSVPGKNQAISPVYYVEIKSPIAPTTKKYYDKLNRLIRTETVGFSGENIRADMQYDEFGRIYKTSLPYIVGRTTYYEEKNYDKFDRLTAVKKPNGGLITIAYSRDTSQGSWPLLKIAETETVKKSNDTVYSTLKKVSYKNAQGQLVNVIDAEGSAQSVTTTYVYDAYGNAISVNVDGGVAGSTVSSSIYDNANNQISITDPNTGTVTTKYNGMGEVISITDASNSTISYQYDRLGRVKSKTSKDGTDNWFYDPASGKGLLDYMTDNKGFVRKYIYSYGRLDEIQTTISIPGLASRTFNESYTRDFYGRLKKTTYPNGFAVSNNYNINGYYERLMAGDNWYTLSQVVQSGVHGIEQEATGSYTESRQYDPKSGQIIAIKTQNGSNTLQHVEYNWLSNASLERRYDYLADVKDEFAYDSHDRLTTSSSFIISSGATRRVISQSYSNLGNLTSVSSSVGSDNRATGYKYKTTANPRPHAVSEVSINGVLTTLNYNANGAVTAYDAAGIANDKYISYNSLNQPTVINVGASSISDTNAKARDEFRYAPDGQRYYRKSSFVESGATRVEHTYYVNGYEFTVHDAASSLATSSRIQIGKLLIVQNTSKAGSVATNHNVLLLDHQGSVVGVVGGNTATRLRMAYEPFGLRRSPTLLTNITSAELANIYSTLDKLVFNGYTNHEILDKTGFIHMNGRVYDPLLGRFLSPDPLVQAPGNSQSWNRYSYVFNNPLKYTDPSGYSAVEETQPTVGARCGEACQRKGHADAFFYQIYTAGSRGGVWESYGNTLYNTATTQGALMMEMAKGMAISNAYIKVAVNGGGSKTNTNNVLGILVSIQELAECRGMCHGIPGRGYWQPMSYSQNMTLVSATLSSIGAGIAGFGCGTTGMSCGLAGVLSVDAGRQFYKASTGNDPLVLTALKFGATQKQAANIALGGDFITAAISINGAYKGLLFQSTQSFSAGSLGVFSADSISVVHTISELNRSVGVGQ